MKYAKKINKIINNLLKSFGILFSIYTIWYLWNENWFFWILFIVHLFSIQAFYLSYFFPKMLEFLVGEKAESFEKMWNISNKFEFFLFFAIPFIALTRDYIYSFVLGLIYLPEALDKKNYKKPT